jgi:hypothetical protein
MLILLSLIITIIYFILNILDKGEIGVQGSVGPQGERGNKGIVGFKGNTGRRGSMGLKGDFFYGSKQGLIGLTGLKGIEGDQGLQGQVGDRGEIGDRGKQGEDGERGDRGIVGSKGVKGNKADDNLLKIGINGNIDEEKKVKTLNSDYELKYYSIDPGKEIGYDNAFSKFKSGIELDSINFNTNWNNVLIGFKLINDDDDDRSSSYYTNIKITNP